MKKIIKDTDGILTICEEDYINASNNFHCPNVKIMHGVGVDLDKFDNCDIDIDKKRKELGFNDYKTILSNWRDKY